CAGRGHACAIRQVAPIQNAKTSVPKGPQKRAKVCLYVLTGKKGTDRVSNDEVSAAPGGHAPLPAAEHGPNVVRRDSPPGFQQEKSVFAEVITPVRFSYCPRGNQNQQEWPKVST